MAYTRNQENRYLELARPSLPELGHQMSIDYQTRALNKFSEPPPPYDPGPSPSQSPIANVLSSAGSFLPPVMGGILRGIPQTIQAISYAKANADRLAMIERMKQTQSPPPAFLVKKGGISAVQNNPNSDISR